MLRRLGRGAAGRFVKVMPRDYKRALAERAARPSDGEPRGVDAAPEDRAEPGGEPRP